MLENVNEYRNGVPECMPFGDSDWAGDRDTRRSTTAVLEKCESVTSTQTVIAFSSGGEEFYALQRAAAAHLDVLETPERLSEVTAQQRSGMRHDRAVVNFTPINGILIPFPMTVTMHLLRNCVIITRVLLHRKSHPKGLSGVKKIVLSSFVAFLSTWNDSVLQDRLKLKEQPL